MTGDGVKLDHSALLSSTIGDAHGIDGQELFRQLRRSEDFSAQLAGNANGNAFLKLPDDKKTIDAIHTYAVRQRGKFAAILVVGIGGSALGFAAIYQALGSLTRSSDTPDARLLDNLDPEGLSDALSGLDPARTLTVVVSKSGNTVETLASLAFVADWYQRSNVELGNHMLTIGAPSGGALKAFGEARGPKRFEFSQDLSGRFSVLSAAALLPAALIGIDIDALLDGAKAQREICTSKDTENPARIFAASHVALCQQRSAQGAVLMSYHSRLKAFGEWYVQLWNESLGKSRTLDGDRTSAGQEAHSCIGPRAQHSSLQLFLDGPPSRIVNFLQVQYHDTVWPFPKTFDYTGTGIESLSGREAVDLLHAQLAGTRAALTDRERPSTLLTIPRLDAYHLGALFMFFECATAYAALYFGVNAFDQPAVELGKQFSRDYLKRTEDESA